MAAQAIAALAQTQPARLDQIGGRTRRQALNWACWMAALSARSPILRGCRKTG